MFLEVISLRSPLRSHLNITSFFSLLPDATRRGRRGTIHIHDLVPWRRQSASCRNRAVLIRTLSLGTHASGSGNCFLFSSFLPFLFVSPSTPQKDPHTSPPPLSGAVFQFVTLSALIDDVIHTGLIEGVYLRRVVYPTPQEIAEGLESNRKRKSVPAVDTRGAAPAPQAPAASSSAAQPPSQPRAPAQSAVAPLDPQRKSEKLAALPPAPTVARRRAEVQQMQQNIKDPVSPSSSVSDPDLSSGSAYIGEFLPLPPQPFCFHHASISLHLRAFPHLNSTISRSGSVRLHNGIKGRGKARASFGRTPGTVARRKQGAELCASSKAAACDVLEGYSQPECEEQLSGIPR